MRSATSLGWDSMTRWEDSISIVVIPARLYPNRSTSGVSPYRMALRYSIPAISVISFLRIAPANAP